MDQQQKTVVIDDPALRQFEGGFTSIPNRVLRNSQVSLGARMCYAMLLSYAWQDDFCFPAQTKLAQDLGIGERTVRQYLNELRDAALIAWKQQGLNRPNIYRILKLPDSPNVDGTGGGSPNGDKGNPGPADSAGPDRQDPPVKTGSQLPTKNTQEKNTHNVTVTRSRSGSSGNARNGNVVKKPPTGKGGAARRVPTPPAIHHSVLQKKYGLTEQQCGQVEHLVDKQGEVLGRLAQNHAAYVKRAAEAAQAGLIGRLEYDLGSFKEDLQRPRSAGEKPVENRAAYFHKRWQAVLEEHELRTRLEKAERAARPIGSGPLASTLAEVIAGQGDAHTSDIPPELDPDAPNLDEKERARRRLIPTVIRATGKPLPRTLWYADLAQLVEYTERNRATSRPG